MAESFRRAAEALVRASVHEALQWRGLALSSHFQPIFGVAREACVGYEALVRAFDSHGVAIGADELFGRAFAEGSAIELDWLCRALHLRNFARVDPGELKLFINVHAQAAEQDTASAGEFADLVRFYGLAPKRVCVEMLEDGVDEPALRGSVAVYRRAGVAIAMDRFGLGRSNVDRIVALRPDIVKIDRAILVDAVGHHKSRGVLRSIVELLHESGAQVVVEGVESAEEALIAMDAGADHLQGFYFGHPSSSLADERYGAGVIGRLARMRAGRLALSGD